MCVCVFVIEKDNCKSPLKIYTKYLHKTENVISVIWSSCPLRVRVGRSIRVAFVMTSDVDVVSLCFFYIHIYIVCMEDMYVAMANVCSNCF